MGEDPVSACDRIQREIRGLPAWPLRADLMRIRASARVFNGNYQEVRHMLRVVSDPSNIGRLFAIQQRAELARFMDDLDRMLHNYLSSGYSFHQCLEKTALERWRGTGMENGYLDRTPYRQPGVLAFMRGLRNVTQHEPMPITDAVMHGHRNESGVMETRHYVTLSRVALSSLDWTQCKKGKAYLNSLTEDPDLEPFIEVWSEAWGVFAQWIDGEYRSLYAAEFADLDRLNRELDAVAAPLRQQLESEFGHKFDWSGTS